MNSCIYEGHVSHARYRPVDNRFRYSLFMMYLDLAELEEVFRGRRLWSVERPNVAWLRRKDYLGDPRQPIDEAVRDLVRERLGFRPEGPVRMLTHLRYFGHNFNPVTFYYCFDRAGREVQTIVANITNTPWGERHSYVLDAHTAAAGDGELRWRFGKIFHVSPFIDMDMQYDWRFSRPGEDLRVHMTDLHDGETYFEAELVLVRRDMTGSNLARVLRSYPPMTMKVIAAIYWQALRLWTKGAKFYTHPAKRTKENA